MHTHTVDLGDAVLHQIIELEIGGVIQSIIDAATPEKIMEIPWLVPHYADRNGSLKGIVQAFVLRLDDRIFVIDTCIGNDKERVDVPEWSQLNNDFDGALARCSLSTSDVTDVLCTHLHMDHVGWNTRLVEGQWQPTFPNARYYFSQAEYDYWAAMPEREIADDLASFTDSVLPVAEAGLMTLVGTDHQFSDRVCFIPTPGHTPSHVSVLVRTQRGNLVITGDALHHPCQVARPDWSTESDYDRAVGAETRTRLLQQCANDKLLMLGSHFALPSLGAVKDVPEGWKFEAIE